MRVCRLTHFTFLFTLMSGLAFTAEGMVPTGAALESVLVGLLVGCILLNGILLVHGCAHGEARQRQRQSPPQPQPQ